MPLKQRNSTKPEWDLNKIWLNNFLALNINKKDNIDPIQNLIFTIKRTIFAIFLLLLSSFRFIVPMYEAFFGVTVTIIGNENGKPSSNPRQGCLHFT